MRRARLGRAPVAAAIACALTCAVAPALADDAACIAAAEQALDLRQRGKLHDARKQLAVCADPACPVEVKTECGRRIDAIAAAMPSLVLGARDAAGNDLSAVTVTLDGAPLTSALDGRPVAVDPGEHTLRFEVAGQPPVERKIVVREGEQDRRESVVLGPASPASSAGASGAATPAPSPAPGTEGFWTPRRTLSVVTTGVGLAGVGAGVVFGLFAASAQKQEKSSCGATSCPNRPQAVEDYDTATKNATGSTIALSVGGALVAGGVVLWLTAPSGEGRHDGPGALRLLPEVNRTGATISLGGTL